MEACLFALAATLHSQSNLNRSLPQIKHPDQLDLIVRTAGGTAASSPACANDVTPRDMLLPDLSWMPTSLHNILINSARSSLL